MADITAQTAARSANELTMASAAAGGDTFTNTGIELLLIINGSGSPITLTVTTPQTVDSEADLAVADLAIVIPAGEQHLIGPFPKAHYNNSSDQVSLSYSAVTSVTLAVIDPS